MSRSFRFKRYKFHVILDILLEKLLSKQQGIEKLDSWNNLMIPLLNLDFIELIVTMSRLYQF